MNRSQIATVLVAVTVLVFFCPETNAAGAGKLGEALGEWLGKILPKVLKEAAQVNEARIAMGITAAFCLKLIFAAVGAILAVLIIAYSISPLSKDRPLPTTSTPPTETPDTKLEPGTFVKGVGIGLGTRLFEMGIGVLALFAFLFAVFLFTLFTGL